MKKGISQESNVRPTLLVILDGFGLAPTNQAGNAITPETAPRIFSYMKQYPSTQLIAHGKGVGLFKNQSGNSEAGHINIGAGRLVKQDLVVISEAIKNGTFFKNESFHQALLHAKKHKSKIHIMGLMTDGQSAHSHPDHLYAVMRYFAKHNRKKVFLHLFTDGRDSTPHSAVEYLSQLREKMTHGEQIATVSGRFYAMDRNKMWERTELAYNALTRGVGIKVESAEDAILSAYNRGENDEYIQPTIITKNKKPIATIDDNDVVVFFNTRSDRARQLTKPFLQPDFNVRNQGSFKRKKKLKNVLFVAMSDFGPDLPEILTAFPSPDYVDCLAEAIGEEYRQLYISETEKYAHVTFFMNGGYPEPINGEDRLLIPSTGEYSYADDPDMSSIDVTKTILKFLKKKTYNFFCVNFPNADMIGHTGDFIAARKAIRAVDGYVHTLVKAFQKVDGRVVITADHGNAEEMISATTGEAMTEHTKNPVPLIIIDDAVKRRRLKKGRLADVAPTLLQLMGISKPSAMSGRSLLR